MPHSVEYKDDGFLVLLHGKITAEEIMRSSKYLLNHSNFIKCRYQLWMFGSVESFKLSEDELKRISDHDREKATKNPNMKLGIVSEPQFIDALGNIFKSFFGDSTWKIMVSDDLYKTYKWINSG